jgi:hypothetical protein
VTLCVYLLEENCLGVEFRDIRVGEELVAVSVEYTPYVRSDVDRHDLLIKLDYNCDYR